MNARQAWALLAAGVLGYEVVCKDGQLLSECVDEWLMSRPILTRAVIAALALHVGNALPVRFDVVSLGSRRSEEARGVGPAIGGDQVERPKECDDCTRQRASAGLAGRQPTSNEPAVSVRSVWAEPSRAGCVDACRRSRNGGVAELGGEAQQQSGRCRRGNRQLLPNPAQ
jgi:hypothetical protein